MFHSLFILIFVLLFSQNLKEVTSLNNTVISFQKHFPNGDEIRSQFDLDAVAVVGEGNTVGTTTSSCHKSVDVTTKVGAVAIVELRLLLRTMSTFPLN